MYFLSWLSKSSLSLWMPCLRSTESTVFWMTVWRSLGSGASDCETVMSWSSRNLWMAILRESTGLCSRGLKERFSWKAGDWYCLGDDARRGY